MQKTETKQKTDTGTCRQCMVKRVIQKTANKKLEK